MKLFLSKFNSFSTGFIHRKKVQMIIKSGIIPRVAFSVFGIDIYWYAIIITFAILVRICLGQGKGWKIWHKI